MKNKFFCLHAHFRGQAAADPRTGDWKAEPSARPWRDADHRLAAEELLPLYAAARVSGGSPAGGPPDFCGLTSFDISPRLLDWLDAFFPELPAALAEADRRAVRESGEGAALAHPWPHAALPLLSPRDRRAAVRWGLDYFERRFKRRAAGMWLPENAADEDTLAALAEAGVLFTVLAPSQARAFRKRGLQKWEPANPNSLDTGVPYQWSSPDGASLAVFFSSPRISGLLRSSPCSAPELSAAVEAEIPHGRGAALASAALDWERHSRRHPGAAGRLVSFLRSVNRSSRWGLSNYASFLRDNRPAYEVEIASPSSSACPHGLERWSGECSCRDSSGPERPVRWRPALRRAAALLEERCAAVYEREGAALFGDPWKVLEEAGAALACADPHEARRFLSRAFGRQPKPAEARKAMELLRMQQARLLSLDSDAWYFDGPDSPAARGALAWAAAACSLAGPDGEAAAEGFAGLLDEGGEGTGAAFLGEFRKPRGPVLAACSKALFLAAGLPPAPRQGRFHVLVNYEERFDKEGAAFLGCCLRVEDRDTLANEEFAVLAVLPREGEAFALAAPAADAEAASASLAGLSAAASAAGTIELARARLALEMRAGSLTGEAAWTAAAAGLSAGRPSADEKSWLSELRRLSPARLQDPSLPALLRRLTDLLGSPPPGAHETCRQAVAHLRLLLERSDPALAFAGPWARLFSDAPFTAHLPGLRRVLAERLEEKDLPAETPAFREAVRALLRETGLDDPYDLEKTKA
ncbi:MAG TPA: DUF3536 domain-containing protein [Elusimicrobiales bacterium]|nr:DUF3536 domain-containing protein [Elusimicrobiales bacterium]